MNNSSDMLNFAVSVARAAGTIMLDYFDRTNQGVAAKADKTLVTEADKRINTLLINKVQAAYPEHGVYGEEESFEAARNELWVCDPIDGTNSFVMGIPTAMFSLAFVVNGEPQLGVLYDPFLDRMFTAVAGEGARMNDQPIHVSSVSEMDGARLNTVGGLDQAFERQDLLKGFMAQGAKVRLVPGNVFQSSILSQGKIDGYIFPGKSAHDIAAAKLVVEEAGGKVTDLRGQPQPYNDKITGAILSNGLLHDQLVQAVAAFGVDRVIGF
jgi:fructose-1,6-bisphosphatase/inositol monophosphatase family enzyme